MGARLGGGGGGGGGGGWGVNGANSQFTVVNQSTRLCKTKVKIKT